MSPPKDSRPENYEMNAKICRLVEQCPFMYDRSHPQYLRKEVCDEAWTRIAKEMGESVFPCRERWRNIRTSFARSININKMPCRANRTKPYYLHEELKFLARHITPGVPVRNRKRAASGSGEESEHIEISVGEETFNGFERLSSMGCESTDTQNGHESTWQRLQQPPHAHLNDGESRGAVAAREGTCDTAGGENDSCHSNSNGPDLQSRYTRLPPPPLQAAPQRGNEETEAAAVLQHIHMSSNDASLCPPLSKRPQKINEAMPVHVNDDTPGLVVVDSDRSREPYVDIGLLQELQTELGIMSHRQRIHLKRRIYEALSEIYPLTTTSTDINPTSGTACNQLALAALLRVEDLYRNLKPETTNRATSAIPQSTIVTDISQSPTIEITATQTPSNIPPSNPPPKRNGMRTRSRPKEAERQKANTTPNGTPVKDEPNMTD